MSVIGGIGPHGRLAAISRPTLLADPDISEELDELETISRGLEENTLSVNTRRAYDKAWRSFESFCADHGLEPLPAHPESVRWYVAWMSTQADEWGTPRFALATIRQYLAGVCERHLRHGYLDPTGHRAVSDLVRGLAKLRAERPVRKRPLLRDDVLRIIESMDHESFPSVVSSSRDAAAIWLGFAGALRRSEAAALRMNSLELSARDGVIVHVGRSKADQMNVLADVVVLPYGSTPRSCAPCSIHHWVSMVRRAELGLPLRSAVGRAVDSGEHHCGAKGSSGLISSADLMASSPLLRATYRNRRDGRIHDRGISGGALGAMLARRMGDAGMDSSPYGFHSLRAGHVTEARRNGASTEEIMRAGRWQKAETVNVYDRESNPAARNSVMRLGL